jgi:formylglycine-generating enzyme required for sulfatase activity
MTEFFKQFLAEDGRRFDPASGRFLGLGAFGKHPGWDDHIEDLGLETDTLRLAKNLLYVSGVGGQIDTGAWEKLDPAKRTEGFNHIFVWQRAGQFLLGRLWSSSDGKGRTRYPMVVCAHCIGLSRAWSLERVLPVLARLEVDCKTAQSAGEVKTALDQARAGLRTGLAGAGDQTQFVAPTAQFVSQFLGDPAFGPNQQGWLRILYHLQSQMASFLRGSFNPKADLSGLRSQHIRVPVMRTEPDQIILFWSRFLSAHIEPSVPMFLAFSPEESWLDAIVGEPAPQDFFCLRARPAALPAATEVPYDLDEKFRAQARALLEDFKSGRETTPVAAPAQKEKSSGGWLGWLRGKAARVIVFLAGVVLVAGAITWLLTRPAPTTGTVQMAADQAASKVSPASAEPASKPRAESSEAKTATPAPAPAAAEAAEREKARLAAQAEEQKRVAEEQARQAAQEQARLKVEADTKARAEADARAKAEEVAPSGAKPMPDAEPKTLAAAGAPPSEAAKTASGTEATTSVAAAGASAAQPAAPPTAAPTGPKINESFTNTLGMVLVWVAGLPGLKEGGWVGKYEVTQKEFEEVMGSNPSKARSPVLPVHLVKWADAVEFCRKLTAREVQAGILAADLAYSLPSQHQWDFFLADASFDNAFTSRALTREKTETAPAPVGAKSAANRFGLFDVLGNVWEWTSDVAAADKRVLKGASYSSHKTLGFDRLDPATPNPVPADYSAPDAGFRCILAGK